LRLTAVMRAIVHGLANVAKSVTAHPHTAAITRATDQALTDIANSVAADCVGKAVIGAGVKRFADFAHSVPAGQIAIIAILRTVAQVFAGFADAVTAFRSIDTIRRTIGESFAHIANTVSACRVAILIAVERTGFVGFTNFADVVATNFDAATRDEIASAQENQGNESEVYSKHFDTFLLQRRNAITPLTKFHC
jgi:hypothetical protein